MNHILSIFEYLAKTNTINFIIMAILLIVILKKINIKNTLDNSCQKIEKSIDDSEKEKKQSKKILNSSKKRLENLPSDIAEIEKFAKQKTKVFEKQLADSCQKNIENIKQNAINSISIEEKKISNEIKSKTIDKSIEEAKNNIIKKLQTDQDLHKKFIKESLEELDRIEI